MTDSTTTNPVQLFLDSLEAFAQSVKDRILAFASDFLPQVEHDAEIALADLAELAMNAVLAQAGSLVSGREIVGVLAERFRLSRIKRPPYLTFCVQPFLRLRAVMFKADLH